MIPIPCPVCGRRESSEFQYWGEVRARPTSHEGDIRAERREHYLRVNDPGWMLERWLHVAGCGRFMQVERNRTSNAIRATHLEGRSGADSTTHPQPSGDAGEAPA